MRSNDIDPLSNLFRQIAKLKDWIADTLFSLKDCDITDLNEIITLYRERIKAFLRDSDELLKEIENQSEVKMIKELKEWCSIIDSDDTPCSQFISLIFILSNLQKELEDLENRLRFFFC